MIYKGHLSDYESIAPLDTKRKDKSLFSNVFRARNLGNNDTVVVKTLHDRFKNDEEAGIRFISEAKYGLDHPNILRYIDHGCEPVRFTVSEFLKGKPAGESGKKFFKRQKDITKHSLEIFIQVCDALEYIHNRGIVHCDIKPANIIVTSEKPLSVKLIDFGQAHLLAGGNMPHGRFPLVYSPPEIILGKYTVCGPHSDIYSAGISLYEIITGSYPYRHCNSLMVMNLQLNHPLPVNSKIPKNIADILAKATAKVPFPKPPNTMEAEEIKDLLRKGIDLRYKTAAEFKNALENCLNEA